VKDVLTDYWLQYKMATIELGELPVSEHSLKSKFAIVTIHDASPAYAKRIFRAADALADLDIPFALAIIPIFRSHHENDIDNNMEWVGRIRDYRQTVILHGFYHEDDSGNIEDFHNYTYDEAIAHLKSGMDIMTKANLSTDIYIPPAWDVNKDTIEALVDNGFSLVETSDEIVLTNKNARLHTTVMNWDQGSPNLNFLCVSVNRRRFREKVLNNSQMIRLAIHPKDDERALKDQIEMIRALKGMNYNFLSYKEVLRLYG
jgi:predicted deacetylase